MIKIITPLICLTILASCSNGDIKINEQKGEITSSIGVDNSDKDYAKEIAKLEKEEAKRLKELAQNSTSLKFDKVKHDFGNVKPETDCITQFRVFNTGDKPLIIEDVSASCGCTTPIKPEAPIPPGKSDVIEVKFHSNPGQLNEILKTVTVTANTIERVHKVEIRAFVKE